eukprot:1160079-Pelagomonas_calceolata.AAC.1
MHTILPCFPTQAHIDPNFDVSWASEARNTASSTPRSSTFFQSSTPPPRSENHDSSTSGPQTGSTRFSSSASSHTAPPPKPRMQQQRIFLYHVAVSAPVSCTSKSAGLLKSAAPAH